MQRTKVSLVADEQGAWENEWILQVHTQDFD